MPLEETTLKTFLKVAVVATLVAIVGVAALAAVVVAQAPDDTDTSPFADWRQEMHEAIARALGVSVDEYDAAVEQARDEVLDEAVQAGDLTQEQAERMRERAEQGWGPGLMGGPGMMGGRGRMGGPGMMAGIESSLVGIAAEQLGLTVAELRIELASGKSIADVAGEQGVSTQAIVDAFLAERQEWLSQAVEDGRLTQEQADTMMAHMAERVQDHVEGELPLGGYGPGGCGAGRGMMGGRGRSGWGGTDL